MKKKFFSALLFAGYLLGNSQASNILSWAQSPDRGLTPGGPSVPASLQTSSGWWTRGSGINAAAFGSGSAIISASGVNSTAFNPNDYFQFSVTPRAGYILDLQSLNIGTRVSSPTTIWSVRSSVDNFAADLGTFSGSSASHTAALVGDAFRAVYGTVTFRVYAWNSGASGSVAGLAVTNTALVGNIISESVSDYHPVGDGQSHPISEWLQGGTYDRGLGWTSLSDIQNAYSALNASLSSPLSLEDQIDFVAISEAFRLLPSGATIRFASGKTYLINRLIDVPKVINGVMHGATMKVAPETSGTSRSPYNMVRMGPESGRAVSFSWSGGTFDGNKDNVDWPGSTTIQVHHPSNFQLLPAFGGTGSPKAFTEEWARHNLIGNNGLFGIWNVDTAVFDGVSVVNSIGDGVVARLVKHAIFLNPKGSNGAPFSYSDIMERYGGTKPDGSPNGKESTFFKTRHISNVSDFPSGTMTVINPQIEGGGSIGIQLTTDDGVLPGSRIVVSGSGTGYIRDMSQESIHIEAAENIEIRDIELTATGSSQFGRPRTAEIQIASLAKYAAIENVTISNGGIDFRTGANLISGKVENCLITNHNPDKHAVVNGQFVVSSTISSAGGGIDLIATGSIANTTITGWVGHGISQAALVTDCVLTNSGSGIGIRWPSNSSMIVDSTEIADTQTGIAIEGGATDVEVKYTKIRNTKSNAISSGTCTSLVITSCDFQDYGTDTTLTAPRRSAIGGGNGGAEAASINVSYTMFRQTGSNAFLSPMIVKPPNSSHSVTWTANNMPWP